MKVIDKEQERIEKENTPEGKKLKLIRTIVLGVIVVIVAIFLYLSGHHPMFIGTPHLVTVGGFEVEPGKTTVSELAAAGFFLSDYNMRQAEIFSNGVDTDYQESYDISSPVEKQSYYDMLILVKNGQQYASLSVVNESVSSATLGDCKVRSITIYEADEESETASLDGVSMDQLNQATLTEVAGEPESISEDTASDEKITVVEWEKGNYFMELSMKEDGTVYRITSKYEKK